MDARKANDIILRAAKRDVDLEGMYYKHLLEQQAYDRVWQHLVSDSEGIDQIRRRPDMPWVARLQAGGTTFTYTITYHTSTGTFRFENIMEEI